MKEISVIIPTRNRRDDLRRCLMALSQQTFAADRFEVIVCDDGSTDDTDAVIAGFESLPLTVRYVRQMPKGPAAARNLGIATARAALIAMTDSDTVPDAAWLEKLHEAFMRHPTAIGVEGRVVADNEGEFDPVGEGPSNTAGGVFLTCNCAYRRAVLIAVGGFDETFPYAAYEDTELAARARRLGEIVWQPEAIVVHPQRPLTVRAVIKKLKHWEYVLLMGHRYGYLAWERYPVTRPRLRVAVLSVIALPLAKFQTAARWLFRKPAAALKLAGFGVVESVGALIIVLPKVLSGSYKQKLERRSYL